MNQQVQTNLLIGSMLQATAQKFFEFTLHELSGDKKAMLTLMINRLKVNRNHLYNTISTEEGRLRFLKEFELGDVLQFGEIFLAILKMNPEQRNMVELICNGIARGEEIKFVDENNY